MKYSQAVQTAFEAALESNDSDEICTYFAMNAVPVLMDYLVFSDMEPVTIADEAAALEGAARSRGKEVFRTKPDGNGIHVFCARNEGEVIVYLDKFRIQAEQEIIRHALSEFMS